MDLLALGTGCLLLLVTLCWGACPVHTLVIVVWKLLNIFSTLSSGFKMLVHCMPLNSLLMESQSALLRLILSRPDLLSDSDLCCGLPNLYRRLQLTKSWSESCVFSVETLRMASGRRINCFCYVSHCSSMVIRWAWICAGLICWCMTYCQIFTWDTIGGGGLGEFWTAA